MNQKRTWALTAVIWTFWDTPGRGRTQNGHEGFGLRCAGWTLAGKGTANL